MISFTVAPFAGAWIEISPSLTLYGDVVVAPFAGAWIEIVEEAAELMRASRRSLRGSVD